MLLYSSLVELTVELLLSAYSQGAFPMVDPDTGAIEWFSPQQRGIIPLDPPEAFRVPKSLAREVRKGRYTITSDKAFEQVMRCCASDRNEWNRSWIDERLIAAYTDLHKHGFAHSVEAWLDEAPVGGLYGVHIGAAFFGESMFSLHSNASKICLVHLVNHLRIRNFKLLDTQFWNEHLDQFGCIEITREQYLKRLHEAICKPTTWDEFQLG